jgi:hypothetical protein
MRLLTIHPSYWLLGVISLALASDVPPATLPKGFLEQLPLLEHLPDAEFENFLQFVQLQEETENLSKTVYTVDQIPTDDINEE